MTALLRFVALALCLIGTSAKAADPGVVMLGIGQYDIIPDDNKAVAGYLQYRWGWGFWESGWFKGFKPIIGGMINNDGGKFGYVGLAAPIAITKNFEMEFSGGPGAYHQGNSTFLGGTFEFHVGLGFSQRIGDRLRVGVAMNHISNANIHPKNRGTNTLMGTVSLELW